MILNNQPGNSLHEPHMTMDSLVGGVYYVNIPAHSGDLVMFDPRGMSPMLSQNVSSRVRSAAEVRCVSQLGTSVKSVFLIQIN